jgi:DNA-directed RNA polymerase specialized sigma24 family protein
MEYDNQRLSEYLLLIKKLTNRKIKSPEHKDIKEDVAHEAFIKLFKQGFFNEHDLSELESQKMITSYIYMTISSCYLDQLKILGFNRKLTKSERQVEGAKYRNIINNDIDDTCESESALQVLETPEQSLFYSEAYKWIKSCFDSFIEGISEKNREKFIYAAFWKFNDYGLSLKELAKHLGYESTNPTQELKRFTQKVSMCTSPHGITVANPSEQIQFLQEQINFDEEIV